MKVHPVRAERVAVAIERAELGPLARLLPLLVPVALAGTAALAAAAVALAADLPTLAAASGLAALFGAALLSEAYPVPVESLPAGFVSLAAVFFVGTALLYGAAEAVVVAVGVRATLDLVQRRPRVRLVYNGSVYALAAAAAGMVAHAVGGGSVGHLVLQVFAAAATYYVVNILLISAAIARWSGEPFLGLLRTSAYWTVLPFAIMSSGTLMLAVLWDRSPPLTLALVGPLLAIALYQRSVHKALVATRLALTDPLTGLGNQRHFHERLQKELDGADRSGRPLALCLLDVDGLKHVNDTYGHPAGDRLLEEVAASLRHGGEAFRVGGDEFALLLPRRDVAGAVEAAEAVLGRVSAIDVVEEESLRMSVRMSAGLAVYPSHCSERSDLYRAADDALYASKREGLNRVHVYEPDGPRPLGAAA